MFIPHVDNCEPEVTYGNMVSFTIGTLYRKSSPVAGCVYNGSGKPVAISVIWSSLDVSELSSISESVKRKSTILCLNEVKIVTAYNERGASLKYQKPNLQ